jgi:ribosomal-protein-alanine N-acetyltransferase
MHESPQVLRTARLILSVPPPDHAPQVLRYYDENRAHLDRWDPPRPKDFSTEAFWRTRLAQQREACVARTRFKFYLRLADDPDGAVVGTTSLDNVVWGPLMACTLGYAVDHRFVGRGFAREAAAEAVRFAFDELGLHRVAAGYDPTNERSARVLDALGFAIEGFARRYLFVGGAWRDHVQTGKVNPRLVVPDPG